MNQLILFRGIQGLGAGGLQPLAFIMVGDMFTLEQRARMQGVFSSVWGISCDRRAAARRLPGRPIVVALGLLHQPHPRPVALSS